MAKNLMMDLLDLAQLDSNTFRVNKEIFSVLTVVKDAFSVVGHIARLKEITLELPTLKQEELNIFKSIKNDKSRLMQALVNLLSNSLKFSNKGSKITTALKIIETQVLTRKI